MPDLSKKEYCTAEGCNQWLVTAKGLATKKCINCRKDEEKKANPVPQPL